MVWPSASGSAVQRGAAVLFALLFAAVGACGSNRGTIATNAPALNVTPAAAAFGTRPPTTHTQITLSIANPGSAAVSLAGAVLQGDTRSTFSGGLLPASVPAGGAITYSLTYSAPATPGADQATLELRAVDSSTPLQIAVTGTTAAPSCTDGVQDGTETGVDCGGQCPGCASGSHCGSANDCASGLACAGGACGSCTTASDCRAGQQCAPGGACVGCEHDADCAAGSTCVNGACAVCPGATSALNTQTDPNNCGSCGNVCPLPVNAAVMCIAGQCSRGPCNPGYYDLGGTFGCQSSCDAGVCTSDDGGTTTVTNTPLPESGNVFRALSSGSSYGGGVQTSPSYTNTAALGESTPPPLNGVTTQSSTHYQNIGGMKSTQH